MPIIGSYKDGTKVQNIMMIKGGTKMKEIGWLKNQLDLVNTEIEIALKAKTQNGQQSVLILNMWKLQVKNRIDKLEVK